MRDDGGLPCDLARSFERIVEPARSRNAHRRAVAEAAVWLRRLARQPASEETAVAGTRVASAPALHGTDNRGADSRLLGVLPHLQQRLGNGNGHHRIVRKARTCAEQREILRLVAAVKFIRRTDHISQNRSVHKTASFAFPLIILHTYFNTAPGHFSSMG